MKISISLHMFVMVCLFCIMGCSSSDPAGSGGAGSNGMIAQHDNPTSRSVDWLCNGDGSGDFCARETFDAHGSVLKDETCLSVTCKEWCQHPTTSCYTYEYDQQGAISIVHYDSDCDGTEDSCEKHTNDAHGNPLLIGDCTSTQLKKCWKDYTYDSYGRKTTEVVDFSCDGSTLICTYYTYDELGRVATEMQSDDCSQTGRCYVFVYDGHGNPVKRSGGTTCDKATEVTHCVEYTY